MHTIKVKINGAEFEASGDEAAVTKQYADFVKLLSSLPGPAAPEKKATGESAAARAERSGGDGESRGGGDQQKLIERVFRVDGDLISLNVLPTGEESTFNAVLLVLYGHQQIANRSAVMVAALLKGLDQSGASYGTNIARMIAGHPGLITKAGVKRGTRYGLTNKGSQQASEVLRRLV